MGDNQSCIPSIPQPSMLVRPPGLLERAKAAARGHPTVLAFATGLLATFYGRHFTYTLLFAQIVDRPDCRAALQRLTDELRSIARAVRFAWSEYMPRIRAANDCARDLMRRHAELHEARTRACTLGNEHEANVLAQEIALLQSDALQMGVAVGCVLGENVDPDRIQASARRIYEGVSVLTHAATSNGCAKVGMRINVGAEIVMAINNSIGNMLRRLLQRLRDRSELVDQIHSDPTSRWWLDWVLSATCNSIGVAIAFYFEGLLFTAANALFGAELLLASAEEVAVRGAAAVSGFSHHHAARRNDFRLPPRVALYGAWLLASGGVAYQVLGRGRQLPLSLRALFFAPLFAERFVKNTTLVVRGPLAPY